MRKFPLALSVVFVFSLIVGFGLLFGGYGAVSDRADRFPAAIDAARTDEATAGHLDEDPLFVAADPYAPRGAGSDESIDGAGVDREDAMDERVRRLEERLASVERRERRVADRERAIEDKLAGADDRPDLATEGIDDRPVTDTIPVVEPRTLWVTLPIATRLKIRFEDAVSTRTSAVGDPVRTLLLKDVISGDLVVFPAGSSVSGMVSTVTPAKRIGGRDELRIDFDRVELPSGEGVWIQASLESLGKSQARKDAATIAGSAAGGAVLGRALGKDESKGTLIGAVLGGAIGAAIASNNSADAVTIEPGTVGKLMLDQPVRVAVTTGGTGERIARR